MEQKFKEALDYVLEDDSYLIKLNEEDFPFKYDVDFRIEVLRAVYRNSGHLREIACIETELDNGDYRIVGNLLSNKEFMMKAADITEYAIDFASKELKNDKEFVLKCVGIDGRGLRFASKRLQNDEEVVKKALKTYDQAMRYAGKKLIKQTEFMDSLPEAVKKYANK